MNHLFSYLAFILVFVNFKFIECGIFRSPLKVNPIDNENDEIFDNVDISNTKNDVNENEPVDEVTDKHMKSTPIVIDNFDEYTNGLMATFYNNITIEEFKDKSYREYEYAIKLPIDNVDFSSAGSFTESHVFGDYFVMEFDGILHVESYGTYTFYITVDDLVDLTIGSTQCVTPSDGSGALKCEIPIQQSFLAFKGRYFEETGPAGISIQWECSDCVRNDLVFTKKRLIPKLAFGFLPESNDQRMATKSLYKEEL